MRKKYKNTKIKICKKEVAYTRRGHILLQGCLVWIDEAQKVT